MTVPPHALIWINRSDNNLDHVVLVGDSGTITQAHMDIQSAGLDWMTVPHAPPIRTLLETRTLQLSHSHSLGQSDRRRAWCHGGRIADRVRPRAEAFHAAFAPGPARFCLIVTRYEPCLGGRDNGGDA